MDNYDVFIFDCDGVILNSNTIKTNAFYQSALPYGELAATELADHHRKNGGISRYSKIDFFLENIKPRSVHGPGREEMLETYATCVKQGLRSCEITSGLKELRKKTETAKWAVVSGGDQAELRQVFADRGIDRLFDGGIFGSPDTKDEIFRREKSEGNIIGRCVFLGDSAYDYNAAVNADVDFVFVSDWTELENWRNWCKARNVKVIPNLQALI